MGRSLVANTEYPFAGNQNAMATGQFARPAEFPDMMYACVRRTIGRVLIC